MLPGQMGLERLHGRPVEETIRNRITVVSVNTMGMKRIVLMGLLSGLLAALGCSKKKDTAPKDQRGESPGAGITVEQEIHVGEPVVIEDPSPITKFAVVFEDDGETGYFYGLDTSRKDDPVLDALHIYNVSNVTDRDIPSTVRIIWSADGLKSALLINKYPHAIFDFQAERGYCRTGFPPPATSWSAEGHEWDDKAQDLFK